MAGVVVVMGFVVVVVVLVVVGVVVFSSKDTFDLPLAGGHRNRPVVVIITPGLLANEILQVSTICGYPVHVSSGLAFIFKSSLSRPLLSGFGRFIWLKVVLNGRPVDIQMSMSVPKRFPDFLYFNGSFIYFSHAIHFLRNQILSLFFPTFQMKPTAVQLICNIHMPKNNLIPLNMDSSY
ncbi:hypothetical protein AGLY_003583 [Aphis glycines]|uniref:Uncharacterized protein n=1 Tax=Aphis glycines TaxID=307491 RepID=A0A6G0TYR6_APHGL|nr:hypothetical protein AGLY_003583 [Aphis glycines]